MFSTPARRFPPLAFAFLLGSAAAALAAGSVVQGETASGAGSVTAVAPPEARPVALTPQACATRFHARLREVREGPFAALKALGAPTAAATASGTGGAGGELVFAPLDRSRDEGEARALRTAVAILRRGQDTGPAPLDADARWVAARLREDLGDYLSQKQTDFLCSGTAEYLAVLRRQAERLGASPARRERDLEAQLGAVRRERSTALRLLEPAPMPTAAPARDEAPALVDNDLRRSVGLAEEPMGPPAPATLLAARQDATRISEGGFDPDLPPLARRPEWRLESEGDILAAIDRLTSEASEAGLLAPAVAGGTDAITTGTVSLAPSVIDHAVRAHLVNLRPLVDASPALRADPALARDITGALSSLEALDVLRQAAQAPGDPLPAAFEATFRAIETARAESGQAAP